MYRYPIIQNHLYALFLSQTSGSLLLLIFFSYSIFFLTMTVFSIFLPPTTVCLHSPYLSPIFPLSLSFHPSLSVFLSIIVSFSFLFFFSCSVFFSDFLSPFLRLSVCLSVSLALSLSLSLSLDLSIYFPFSASLSLSYLACVIRPPLQGSTNIIIIYPILSLRRGSKPNCLPCRLSDLPLFSDRESPNKIRPFLLS